MIIMFIPLLIPLVTGASVAFWLLAPVMILGALGMILSRKPVHSAMCLAAVMISLAIQYAALQAPFLFVVQIIVYTGAILMLFLFVLMLVGVDIRESLVETIKAQRTLAVLAGLGLGSLLIFAVGNAIIGPNIGLRADNEEYGGNVQGIAALLFDRYVFAFEATSALLITAAVGAMVLAHRERLTKRRTQADLAETRMQRYAETGQHPGPLPTPGVFARHNAGRYASATPGRHLSLTSRSRQRCAPAARFWTVETWSNQWIKRWKPLLTRILRTPPRKNNREPDQLHRALGDLVHESAQWVS
jgi:NADH-quinone oxidoreductase subunit J